MFTFKNEKKKLTKQSHANLNQTSVFLSSLKQKTAAKMLHQEIGENTQIQFKLQGREQEQQQKMEVHLC